MFDNIDWGVVTALSLLAYVIYAFVIPPKWWRDQQIEDERQASRKTARKIEKPSAPRGLIIADINFVRGSTSGFFISSKPQVFLFERVFHGDWTQTIYFVVDGDGKLQPHDTLDLANAAIKPEDLGISACTVAPGMIKFRDVLPKGREEKDLYALNFNFVTNP